MKLINVLEKHESGADDIREQDLLCMKYKDNFFRNLPFDIQTSKQLICRRQKLETIDLTTLNFSHKPDVCKDYRKKFTEILFSDRARQLKNLHVRYCSFSSKY